MFLYVEQCESNYREPLVKFVTVLFLPAEEPFFLDIFILRKQKVPAFSVAREGFVSACGASNVIPHDA